MRQGVVLETDNDPGPCYFDALYNLATRQVSLFNMHDMVGMGDRSADLR